MLWKAVILIDEADVFLEERSAHDIVRNNFVAGKRCASFDEFPNANGNRQSSCAALSTSRAS